MFCSKCGYKLDDDAIFCQKCGTRLKQTDNYTSITQKKPSYVANSELDHEALKIYLRDLLAMECIKKRYTLKLSQVNSNLLHTSGNYLIKSYFIPRNERMHWRLPDDYNDEVYFHYMYDNDKYYILIDTLYKKYPYIYRTYGKYYDVMDARVEIGNSLGFLMKDESWKWLMSANLGLFERKKAIKEARESCIRYFEEFKKTAVVEFKNKKAKSNIYKNDKIAISKEINNIERILKKLYDVNIIPAQFRHNQYAICYLYEFINTSNQPLSTALLHFDFKEIKDKLDTVISQQEDQIIQQAQIISQNQEILTQNQQQLKRLSNIESNTEQAAIYSEIAACNAETCAWFSLANYLKVK